MRYVTSNYRPVRGCISDLARRLGVTCWTIARILDNAGIVRRIERPRWTPKETARLEELAGRRSVRWIAREMRRTVAGVSLRMKYLRISAMVRDGHTVTSLAECFGVDRVIVLRWIRQKRLTGARRSGAVEPETGMDPWQFSDAQVLRFVREHPTAFDLRRVDQTWFLDLLFNRRATGKARHAA